MNACREKQQMQLSSSVHILALKNKPYRNFCWQLYFTWCSAIRLLTSSISCGSGSLSLSLRLVSAHCSQVSRFSSSSWVANSSVRAVASLCWCCLAHACTYNINVTCISRICTNRPNAWDEASKIVKLLCYIGLLRTRLPVFLVKKVPCRLQPEAHKLRPSLIPGAMTELKGTHACTQLWTDLFEAGFNDGVPVFNSCDRVWVTDGQNSLPHTGCFI